MADLKQKVTDLMRSPRYQRNQYTNLIEKISNFNAKLSEKQRTLLAKHIAYS